MALQFAPKLGTVVLVNFDKGFMPPEMVKPRLAIVVSPPIKARGKLLTVVPLSTTAPTILMPYHCQIDIPFHLPAPWGNVPRWVKGDMINAVSFDQANLLSLEKTIMASGCIKPARCRRRC
ncbi:MAG: type II toxin-antitoxin system PemK/MazF family toxin [Cypionkella sp.]|nr:type II toxin-antitoxin system PemK/MazF family toxin [Cypionkella sp.]